MKESVIREQWNHHLLTLNEVRIALNLEPDPIFGDKYKYQLFATRGKKSADRPMASFVRQLEKDQRFIERVYGKQLNRFFRDQKKNLADLTYKKKNVERALSALERALDRKQKDWEKKSETIFKNMVKQAIKDTMQLNAEHLNVSFDKNDPLIQAYIDNRSKRWARDHVHTTIKNLYKTLEKAKKENWNIRQVREAVRKKFDQFVDVRTPMILQTEVVRASNYANEIMYKRAGFTKKKWHAEEGACEFCQAMDGKIVMMGQTFAKLGDELEAENEEGKKVRMKVDYEDVFFPPMHPNCRCSIIPVKEGEVDMEDIEWDDLNISPDEGEHAVPFGLNELKRDELDKSQEFWLNQLDSETEEFGLFDEENIKQVAKQVMKRIKKDPKKYRYGEIKKLAEESLERVGGYRERYKDLTKDEHIIAEIIEAWNDDSAYGMSVDVQRAAVKEFGLYHAYDKHLEDEYYGKDYELSFQGIVRAIYDNTQEYFEKLGVDHVIAFRGMVFTKDELDEKDLFKHDGNPRIEPIRLAPLNPFTAEVWTAYEFTGSLSKFVRDRKYAVVMGARIPVKRILSTSKTGFGTGEEAELIVLGPTRDNDLMWTVRWNNGEKKLIEKSDGSSKEVTDRFIQASQSSMAQYAPDEDDIQLPRILETRLNLRAGADPEFQSRIHKQLSRGVKDLEDVKKVGDMVQYEIRRRQEVLGLDKVEDRLKDWTERIRNADGDSLELEDIKRFLDEDALRYQREMAALRLQVLKEIRPFGMPKGAKVPFVPMLVQGKPVNESLFKYMYKQADEEQLQHIFETLGEYYPTSWLEYALREDLFIVTSSIRRSHYIPMEYAKKKGINSPGIAIGKNQIKNPESLDGVMLHELAHHLEKVVPNLGKLEGEWLKSRLKPGEKPVKLSEAAKQMRLPIRAMPNEIVYLDELPHPYIGKKMNAKNSFEILSTGMEYLFRMDINTFSRYRLYADADLESFILGLLTAL